MYVGTLPFPNSFVVHNPQINLQQKVAVLSNPLSGFSNSGKWVYGSRTISIKNDRFLSVAMCGRSRNQQELEEEDGFYMRRCVELAKKAIGCTSPNPMVGCVIVKDGQIVGQGFHPRAGQPHAEVFALCDAGDMAENGTVYVSLEPCNHYGRTPPCTEALIKAKVKSVVIGMVDPNPLVASTGVKRLEEAGIKVTVGVEEEMCKRLNEVFVHHILTRKPYVTLRYSMSLDGHILNHLGDEAIDCGGYYSKLLQEYDAVVLSSTTLTEKSNFLISSEPGANQPVKIVVSKSPNSRLPIPALDDEEASKLVIITDKDTILDPLAVREGIQTLSFDRVSLLEILENCEREGMCSVLLDSRGDDVDFEDLIKEGFESNLFRKVVVEVLPFFGGGREISSKYRGLNAKLKKLTSFVTSTSVVMEGYF